MFCLEYVACDVRCSLYLLEWKKTFISGIDLSPFFHEILLQIWDMAAVEGTQRPNGYVCYA